MNTPAEPDEQGRLWWAQAVTPMERQRLLIVDDEPKLTEVLKGFLARRGFEVWTACKGEDALSLIQTHQPDVLLLDLHLGGCGLQSLDVLRKTTAVSPNTTVIVISACTDTDTKAEVLRLGARRYLDKPLDLEKLVQTIQDLAVPSHS